MPISFEKAQSVEGIKKLSIPIGDETLNVLYNRDKYTPKLERKMRDLMDQQMPANSLAQYVVGLVIDWDIYVWIDANGELISEQVATGQKSTNNPDALDVYEEGETKTEESELDEVETTKKFLSEDGSEDITPVLFGNEVLDAEFTTYVPVAPFRKVKLPFSAKNLAKFGISFISLVISAIAEAQRPNQKASGGTNDTF